MNCYVCGIDVGDKGLCDYCSERVDNIIRNSEEGVIK